MNEPAIAIFTDQPGWHGERLREAFARRAWASRFVSLTECRLQVEEGALPVHIPGFERQFPRAAFVRGVPGGSLQEITFYLDILHALKLWGVPVYNDAHAIERSVDKAMTSLLLRRAGLPTPPTWVFADRTAALACLESEWCAGHSVLSKPLFGSQGEGIRRFEKRLDGLWLTPNQGIYYLQRFIPCAGEAYSDFRVFVIHHRVVGVMRRWGRHWLNNVAQGARCEAVAGDHTLHELALAAVRVLDMDYAGVDILEARDGGYVILEVNSIPAWKGLQSVCAEELADLLVADLLERYLNKTRAELPTKPGHVVIQPAWA